MVDVDISRILLFSLAREPAIIPLGPMLPSASSTRPVPVHRSEARGRGQHRVVTKCSETACACTRRGLPCLDCRQPSGALLPHRFTLTVALTEVCAPAVCFLWHFP